MFLLEFNFFINNFKERHFFLKHKQSRTLRNGDITIRHLRTQKQRNLEIKSEYKNEWDNSFRLSGVLLNYVLAKNTLAD